MEIFFLSQTFPVSERYSLVDQILRSSRSVASNVTEAWRKRRYRAAFISKLNDVEGEAAETQTWIEFARRYRYIDETTTQSLDVAYDTIIGEIISMISNNDKWTLG